MPKPNPRTNPLCPSRLHGTVVAGRSGCICAEVAAARARNRPKCDNTLAIEYTPEELERFWESVGAETQNGCREWMGERNPQNYGTFTVYRGGVRVRRSAHRVAYSLAVASIEPGLVVRHQCDNPPCCATGHLLTGTQRDNMQDALQRGRTNMSGLVLGQRRSVRSEAAVALEADGLKRCAGCKAVLPLDMFYVQANAASKRKARCKPCSKTYSDTARARRDARRAAEGWTRPVLSGAEHPRSVLTDDAARTIRDDTRPASVLAREFGISKGQACRIRKGTAWGHLS